MRIETRFARDMYQVYEINDNDMRVVKMILTTSYAY